MDRSIPAVPPPTTVYVSRIPLDLDLKDNELFDILDVILKQFGKIKYVLFDFSNFELILNFYR